MNDKRDIEKANQRNNDQDDDNDHVVDECRRVHLCSQIKNTGRRFCSRSRKACEISSSAANGYSDARASECITPTCDILDFVIVVAVQKRMRAWLAFFLPECL